MNENHVTKLEFFFSVFFLSLLLGVYFLFFYDPNSVRLEQEKKQKHIQECAQYCDKTLGETPNQCLVHMRGPRLITDYYGECKYE